MKKVFAWILILVLMISGIPNIVQAEYTPPKNFGPPQDFSVHIREDGFEKTWQGFEANVSASDELRSLVDVIGADNSPFYAAGYNLSEILLQLDYMVDSGDWHYKTQWDEDLGYNSNKSTIRIEKGQYSSYAIVDKGQFESISAGETLPADKSYFDTHKMDFRARFIVSYQDINGQYYNYFSPWSQTASYSNNQKVEDPNMLINHVPVLKSAELKKYSDGSPYLDIKADKAHEDMRNLNTISNSNVKTEVWLRVDKGEWKACHSDNFVEEFNIGAEAYFGLKDNYAAAVYEIKFRYIFDYLNYPAAGKSGVIYSPFSNVITHGMTAYSNASNWAKTELDKAAEYDLIPQSLKGADMTKSITREEFAEVAVKLYEKTTGTIAPIASPNPFTDTKNQEVLKALKIGVTTGTSKTTFTPKELMNREQVATMLSRAIRIMAPDGDFSSTGAPTFSDQKNISSWALEHVLYMAKSEIIKGADGKFMPKNITAAEIATGYANTTREMAILMSMRAYEKQKASKPTSEVATPKQIVETTINIPVKVSNGMPSLSGGGLSGVWMGYYVPYGSYSPVERYLTMYEDGTFYHDIPSEGLEGFDRVKSQNDENQKDAWGIYTFNGGTGTWKYNRTTTAPAREIKLAENGGITIGSETYYPLADVDGIRLDGAWTTYADPKDPDLGEAGVKAIIRFTKDGRFKDEGLFVTGYRDQYIKDKNGDEIVPGEGSYEINDFTITLKYDNGCVLKSAFSFGVNAKVEMNSNLILIHHMRMWKTDY